MDAEDMGPHSRHLGQGSSQGRYSALRVDGHVMVWILVAITLFGCAFLYVYYDDLGLDEL